MIDSYARNFLPRMTGMLIRVYRRCGCTPNQLTVAGFLCAVGAAVLVALHQPLAALLAWWIGRLFDGTDGILARQTGAVSDFGGYLDITLDMAAYSAMILGFYLWQPQHVLLWMVTLMFYVLAITSALSLGALQRARGLDGDDRSLKLAAGLAEGGETGICYSLILLLPAHIDVILSAWLVVLACTLIARTWLAWRVLR